jgi:hypothetical protein
MFDVSKLRDPEPGNCGLRVGVAHAALVAVSTQYTVAAVLVASKAYSLVSAVCPSPVAPVNHVNRVFAFNDTSADDPKHFVGEPPPTALPVLASTAARSTQ